MNTKYATHELSQAIAASQDHMLAKLLKPKSRLEASNIIELEFDEELGLCEIYYRNLDLTVSPQSDQSGDAYTIELVKCNGVEIQINGVQEQAIHDYLNRVQPDRPDKTAA